MYYVELPGTLALDQLEGKIIDEELGASRFVESKIAQVKKGSALQLVNLLKFVELAPGEVPLEPKLSSTKPDDSLVEWRGAMLINGKTAVVYVSRATP